MNILVTGASGFLGQALCRALSNNSHHVTAIFRKPNANITASKKIMCHLDSHTELIENLKSIDIVIHLAARTHVLNEKSLNPYLAYAEINVEATRNLAMQALNSGVKRFIYISSIKVNGEQTFSNRFSETSTPKPEDDYGKTKFEAENALRTLAENSSMEYVIIRPPLIYGKGVKANFNNLIKLCKMSIPLPFGTIYNKRSLIYIENLVNFIELCIHHPKAVNQIFLVSDDDDVSTTELIKRISQSCGKKPLLMPINQSILIAVLNFFGKKNLAVRLCGNLQVDMTKAKTLLGWKPLFSFKEGIIKTVQKS